MRSSHDALVPEAVVTAVRVHYALVQPQRQASFTIYQTANVGGCW
jgi:hypothetical protein